MTSFDTLLFTEAVRALQEEDGSRDRMEASYRNRNTTKLGPDESAFIESQPIVVKYPNKSGWLFWTTRETGNSSQPAMCGTTIKSRCL